MKAPVFCLLWDPHQKLFLLSWCYHPAWKFGLYRFHTSVDSAQTAKQLLCKDAGDDCCRGQQAVGENGYTLSLSAH